MSNHQGGRGPCLGTNGGRRKPADGGDGTAVLDRLDKREKREEGKREKEERPRAGSS
jgi:hypothetical protein